MKYRSKSTGEDFEISEMVDSHLYNTKKKLEKELNNPAVPKDVEWYRVWEAIKEEYEERFAGREGY